MKSFFTKERAKKNRMNSRGVFGLTSVQAFFAIILGVVLLAYVIVVIMGTLMNTTIIPRLSGSTVNESVTPTTAGTALAANSNPACVATVTNIFNGSQGTVISSGNWTVSACTLFNTTSSFPGGWNVTYSYTYDSVAASQSDNIAGNTSQGITGFFSSINPVYAILAILVIILVLVVLVRVVTGNVGERNASGSGPQL